MQVSTHFSNFVFDMMSSFQLTKISPISPSVRQPESAIGFWKTCSQKIRKVSNSSETKAAQPLVQLSSDFAFFECSVSNFLEVKSNSLWAFVTLFFLSTWPHSDTSIAICKAGASTGTCRLTVQQKSIPMISESIATQITLTHHTCPHTQSTHSQPVCRAPAFQGVSAQGILESRIPV